MGYRFIARGKTLQARAVYYEDVEPPVVVVVVKGDAATCSFEQILILVLSAEYGFDVQTGFASDVKKANTKIGRLERGFFVFLSRGRGRVRPSWTTQPQDALHRQDQRGPAERFQKYAA